MGNSKTLTVGKLKAFLKKFDPDTEITFGSSTYSMKPLIFSRFKDRGENLLHIEVNELDDMEGAENPLSENELRQTVEYFLKHLEYCNDGACIIFGSTTVTLEFKSMKQVVAINLEQNKPPK